MTEEKINDELPKTNWKEHITPQNLLFVLFFGLLLLCGYFYNQIFQLKQGFINFNQRLSMVDTQGMVKLAEPGVVSFKYINLGIKEGYFPGVDDKGNLIKPTVVAPAVEQK